SEMRIVVKDIFEDYLINADKAFPFDPEVEVGRFDVNAAYSQITALQAKLGDYEKEMPIVAKFAMELGLDRAAEDRITLYRERSDKYLETIRMQARRFELMTLYPIASEVLLSALKHLLLTEEAAEAIRVQAEELS